MNEEQVNNVPNTNREIAFVARPFYERDKNGPVIRHPNYLEPPWTLMEERTVNNIIARPDYRSGTIWTGTAPGVDPTGNRQIYLQYNSNAIYLPAGDYKLSGAPAYRDRRAKHGTNYWGIRLYRVIDEQGNDPIPAFPYTSYGFPENTAAYSDDDISSSYIDNETMVYDHGYGAEFTLSEGTWVRCDIFINKKPGNSSTNYRNYDINTDVWKPRLIRLGEEGYLAPEEE